MQRSRRGSEDVFQEAMISAIRSRLVGLRDRPYRELQDLPEWSSEELVVDGVAADITTYREGEPPWSLRIIVQLSTKPKRFLGFFRTRQVLAEGFEIPPGGEAKPLLEKDLYHYM